jgi:Caspase domain
LSKLKSGTPLSFKFRCEHSGQMFGLIIGIDEYQSPTIPNLRGCKENAQSIVDLLSYKFDVRPSHFLCLANERATRDAIMNGFQRHLIENSNIARGDAIVIYYAGHSSQTAASKGKADSAMEISICPHDASSLIDGGNFGQTIDTLVQRLADIKGDNIVCLTPHPVFSSDYFAPIIRPLFLIRAPPIMTHDRHFQRILCLLQSRLHPP